MPLRIETDAFEDGGIVPFRHSCFGANVQPGFRFLDAPDGTASFAIVFHDIDVALDGGTEDGLHWVVWNIPPSAGGIPENGLPDGAVTGRNVEDRNAFLGPGAPSGARYHHYVFELFALDSLLASRTRRAARSCSPRWKARCSTRQPASAASSDREKTGRHVIVWAPRNGRPAPRQPGRRRHSLFHARVSVTKFTELVRVANYFVACVSYSRATSCSKRFRMEKAVPQDRTIDPGQTYVLEETSITRCHSLEELAEIALRQTEAPDGASGADARSGQRPELRKSPSDLDRRGRSGV